MNGVFAVDRGVFDHAIFAREPYSEREAWIWLCGAAAWKATRVRVGKAMIDLQRGQLAYATRFLATKWQWSHTRVVRFLKRLESDTMVSTEPTRYATRITVCNYEKYAFGRNAADTQIETPTGSEVKRSRYKEEELKNYNKEENKEDSRAVADAPPPRAPDRFDEFWKAYPRRDGANPRAPAEKKFKALVKSGVDPEMMIVAVRALASAESAKGNIGTPFIPQAKTWLNQQRWSDHAAITCDAQSPTKGFYAKEGSEQLAAWDAYGRLMTGKGQPRDKNQGWRVESEWPPANGKSKSAIIQAADDLCRTIAGFDGPKRLTEFQQRRRETRGILDDLENFASRGATFEAGDLVLEAVPIAPQEEKQ